ncbi:MAG: enoyl-CoA hydratase-related protein [Minwuia sp.]|nr:enoyl-CoA hydratase-related protein [Minwuia sp.]
MSDLLRTEDKEGVRLMVINRPDALNALNMNLYDALRDGLSEAAARDDIAVVVITGEGRAFCAGTDLGELADPPRPDDHRPHGFEPFMDTLQTFPKPLIAAVNGIGIGIGLTMLPHCDLVLMADNARLRAPFVELGVTAEAGSTFLLPAAIGWAETAHLLYTAGWIDADKAVETGLAWRRFPDAQLMPEAMSLAQEIARMPVSSLVATKKLLLDARLSQVNEARAREVPTFRGLVGGPANREAITAFQEKRSPDFTKLR